MKKINIVMVILVLVIILLLTNNSSEVQDVLITPESEIPEQESVENEKIYVDIKGAVSNPGMYEMKNGDRIADVLENAGGYNKANELCLNLSEKLSDEQEIYVPSENEDCIDEAIVNGVVNINKANVYELMQISGIGETRAQAIIDYREANGNFQTIEDIKNVDGIGDATFESIKSQITV